MRFNILNYNFKNLAGVFRRREEKPAAIKAAQLAFSLCFVLGIISANLMGRGETQGFGIWNAYFIEKFKYASIRPDELFLYVLEMRLPLFLLLLALTMTSLGMAAGVVFIGWQGFAGGFLMAASIIAYGLKGIFLVVAAMLPQSILYFPIYLACLYLAIHTRKKAGYLLSATICIFLLVIYLIGIFLESYLNPALLKYVISFF